MKIPKIIHIVWLGKNTHPYSEFLEKWRALHPDWEVKLWDDRYIELSPRKDIIKSLKHFSAKSNIIRLELIGRYGGVYADVDIEPLQNLESLLGELEAFIGYQIQGEKVCNAIFGATARHPWVTTLLEILPAFQDQSPPWGSIHMMEALKKHKEVRIFNREVFYPFLWMEPEKAQGPFSKNTYTRHFWARSWKQFKNVIPIK